MANAVEQVLVSINGDASGLKNAVKDAQSITEKSGNSIASKFGSAFATAGKVAAAGLAAGTVAAVAFAKSSVSAFNEAQLSAVKFANAAANQNWSEAGQKQLNDLSASLQKVGVVEGDAITAGQAQLGTFNLQSDAVAKLTPALADLAANQTGAATSAQDMAGYANLVGKAMTGNAGALTKVGVTLTDTQKAMIENGTEMEKASAIADALSANYGGLNERLGQTAQGGLVQVKNAFGDVQEAIGGLLTGQGTVDDLNASIDAFIQSALNNIPKLVESFGKVIPDIAGSLVPLATSLLPSLVPAFVDGFVAIVKGVVDALPKIIDVLTAAIPDLINGLVSALPEMIPSVVQGFIALFLGLVKAVNQIIAVLVPMLPQIIQSIVDQIPVLIPALIQGFISLILGIVNALPQIIQSLVDALPYIVSTMVSTLLENLPTLIEGFIQIFVGLVGAMPRIIGSLLAYAPKIIEGIVTGLVNAFPKVLAAFGQLFGKIGDAIGNFVGGIGKFFGDIGKNIWNALKGALKGALGAIPVIGGAVVSALHLASGGYVSGAGGATADKIPAMLSNGEYVLNARATANIGADALNYMNQTGNLLAEPTGSGGETNITVNAPQNADPIALSQQIAQRVRWAVA